MTDTTPELLIDVTSLPPGDTEWLTVLLSYRRLARRGGIRRIQSAIYDDVRAVLRARLEAVRFIPFSPVELHSRYRYSDG